MSSDIKKVQRNTFYKKQDITTGINIKPTFKDLAEQADPRTGNTTFTLANMNEANVYVLSGTVPDTPEYGNSQLVGGFLSLYCNTISGAENRSDPSLLGYKLQPDITLAEGSYNLAVRSGSTTPTDPIVGSKVAVYNSMPVSMVPMIAETFDSQTSLGGVSRLGANSVLRLTEPYIQETDLKALLKADGRFTNEEDYKYFKRALVPVYHPSDEAYVSSTAGFKYTRTLEPVVIGYALEFRNDYRRPVFQPTSQNTDDPSWAHASGLSKVGLLNNAKSTDPNVRYPGPILKHAVNFIRGISGRGPAPNIGGLMWAYDRVWPFAELDQMNYIQFKKTAAASGDLDQNPTAVGAGGNSNTIFDTIKATKNSLNPYEAGIDQPLMLSEATLTTENSLNQGQSLRLYHNWGYSPYNSSFQDILGDSLNLNPQCIMASMYNIPYPSFPWDAGMSQITANHSDVNMFGSMRAVVPEISMGLYVSKLSPNLPLNVSGGYIDKCGSPYYGGRAITPPDAKRWNGTAYQSGATAQSANNFTNYENTFLRSIVVTFSNYKPLQEHSTLDDFLNYGLDRFYTSQTDNNIVGGYILTTWDMSLVNANDSNKNPSDVNAADEMWAYPLPVTRIPQVTSSPTPLGASQCFLSGGIGQPLGTAGEHLNRINTLTWGVTPTGNQASDRNLRCQKLPLNSWINSRVFTDIFQHNNIGSVLKRPYAASSSSNPTTNDPATSGVPMRVLFETAAQGGDPASPESFSQYGTTVDDAQVDIPFIDVFFPVGHYNDVSCTGSAGSEVITCSSSDKIHVGQRIEQTVGTFTYLKSGSYVAKITAGTEGVNVTEFEMNRPLDGNTLSYVNFRFWNGPPGSDDYTFAEHPEWYPKHMTIWVQNYPWVSGSSGGAFKAGDDNYAPSGCTTEVEMFIDNVMFYNYGPTVDTITAGNQESNVSFSPRTYTSPLAGMVSGNAGGTFPYSGGTFKTGWVQSRPLEDQPALVSIQSGSDVGKMLVNEGSISIGDIENSGEFNANHNSVTITGTGIPAATYMDFQDNTTFYMKTAAGVAVDATITNTALEVTLNSSGTAQPYLNVCNTYPYDIGNNLVLGFNDKGDLPISSDYATSAAGYLLFNNFNTDDWEGVSLDPIIPNKTNHLGSRVPATSAGTKIGALSSQAPADAQDKRMGAQMYAPNYYIEGTTTGSNLSGAAFRIVTASDMGIGITFTGGGLNDMTIDASNDYNAETNKTYRVQVDGTGTPDTFKWSDDNGSTWEATEVNMAATNTLNNGVVIKWGATTGHTATNYWSFTATSSAVPGSVGLPTGNTAFVNNDGFRQKGFMYLNVSGQTFGWNANAYTGWTKRENVLVSTKVIGYADKSITVADPSIFNPSDEEETYVLYYMGADDSTTTTQNRYRRTGLTLDTSVPSEGNSFTFTEKVTLADDGKSTLLSGINLSYLYIGPEKYWMNLLFSTPSEMSARNYESVCTINQTPTTGNVSGSTCNEYTYTYDSSLIGTGGSAAKYVRLWDLKPTVDSTTVITDQDFGYTPIDPETDEGGQFLSGPIREASFLHYDVSQAVQDNTTKTSDNFPLALYFEHGGNVQSKAVFEDDDSAITTKRPTLYWKFKDLPPTITDFAVKPAVDVLTESTNLYKLTTENLNAVEFTWNEENADDVWYRMLMVDTGVDIESKYHKAKLWLPLNEAFVPTAVPSYTFYSKIAGSAGGSATVGTDVRGVIYGQGGYGAKLASATALTGSIVVPKATNSVLTDETEFILTIHWTPSTADNGAISYIAHQTTALGTAAGNFELFKNANDNMVCKLGADIAMTGSSFIPTDGSRPVSVIVTFKKDAPSGPKAKLYVNGVLDDSSTGTTEQTTTADFTLGGSGTSTYRTTTGVVEEVLMYTKAYDIVENSNSYVFNTDVLEDSDADNSVNRSHSARLIVADYHNFRGTSQAELGTSTITSWRATN